MDKVPDPSSVPLSAFVEILRNRRAVRSFLSDPVDDDLLDSLLEAARWAPSGYNLQPTHWVVVRDPKQKEELRQACLDQRQITEAPVSVVFVGDLRVYQNHFERILRMDLEAEAINEEYVALMRKFVPIAFGRGFLDIMRALKTIAMPVLRMGRPMPTLPAVEPRFWLAKQSSLSAMNFMAAAAVAGLATCPMEGFDEQRAARCLNLPSSTLPILIVPTGYEDPQTKNRKTRIPLKELVHYDRW